MTDDNTASEAIVSFKPASGEAASDNFLNDLFAGKIVLCELVLNLSFIVT